MIVADETAVQKYHLQPLARILGWHAVGCEPAIMGIGPVPAIRTLVKKTGVPLEKVDLVEVRFSATKGDWRAITITWTKRR